MFRFVPVVLSATLCGACAWQPPPQEPPPPPRPSAANWPAQPDRRYEPASEARPLAVRAANVAVRQVGAPYRYGGTTPSGFDCSGLVQYAYRQVGVRVPRTTAQLWRHASPVNDDRMRPGDLLFFDIGGKPSHVGIYLGDGRFVHAPSTGRRVTTESLSSEYYRRRLLRAGRLAAAGDD